MGTSRWFVVGIVSFTLWGNQMGKVKNQMDIAAECFEELVKAVENAPYNYEVEERLNELRIELIELGLDIRR
jgi:hypothetical protein